MIDLTALGVFAAALFLTALSPGPSIAALVSRVIAGGWRDVLPFVAAMWIGEVIWLSCAIAGLITIAETFETGFVIIRYAGVAYLLYLAWKMWTAPAVMHSDSAFRPPGSRMFLAGLSVTLGNPKIMVFYLALLPTLIDLNAVSFSGWLALAAVTIVVLAAIDLTYMALASRARLMLKTPSALRLANRTGAVSLGGAAAFIASR